jgi:hypothetical protein
MPVIKQANVPLEYDTYIQLPIIRCPHNIKYNEGQFS